MLDVLTVSTMLSISTMSAESNDSYAQSTRTVEIHIRLNLRTSQSTLILRGFNYMNLSTKTRVQRYTT